MSKGTNNYTITQFRKDFPNDDACLHKIFELRFSNIECCPKCGVIGSKFSRVKSRMCYQCSECLHQVYPMAGTIFEKTKIPLTYWFYIMFVFTASKNGVSAYEVQRQLGVTYKTAWRMLKQIRVLMASDAFPLFEGSNEIDESFIGGKNKNRHADKKVKHSQGRSFKDKTPVFGIYNRKESKVKCFVTEDTQAKSLQPIIRAYVPEGTILNTDEWSAYNGLEKFYTKRFIEHSKGKYADGNTTTNRIENFWSHLKRTLHGSYISVSKKYLQLYVEECTFRFNNRNSKESNFHLLLDLLVV